MAFKSKIKSRVLVNERQTVDAKHNNVLQQFIENKSYLPTLKEQLEQIKTEIIALNQENSKLLIINLELQKKIWKLDDRKRELEKEIANIEQGIDENTYMLKTGKILSDYYKILDQEKQFASGEAYLPGNINNNIKNNMHIYNANTTHANTTHATHTVYSSITKKNDDSYDIDCNILDTNKIIINEITKENITEKLQEITLDKTLEQTASKSVKSKSIIDWFSQTGNNPAIFENVDTGKKVVNIIKKKTLCDFKEDVKKVEEEQNHKRTLENKETIYEKYMKSIDKNYVNINNDNIDVFDSCSKCMLEMLLNNNTGVLICPNCGMMENIIVDSDKPSFKEPPKEMTSFCYKRINHLNEFLAQFQAKETTDIPEDVYNEILMEIKKERITNMAMITPEKMRVLLKKIKKNDYYEHIPYIINQLNGLPAPVIAPEIEEIIRGMFKAIQIPFEKYCPHKRKNFLSYNYVMYKFFELLELDEYLTCFQLLKSRTKLHQQDQIWKNICSDLNWQFIRSL